MLGLAAPVISKNLLQTLLGVVETLLVAGLGAVALASIGTALQAIFVLIGALSALSVGASVQMAQAFGVGDLPAASRFARQALVWSAIISVSQALLGMLLTPTVLSLFSAV
jgi:multidrug resistance protein, MATE family